jgi:hypothetical protein
MDRRARTRAAIAVIAVMMAVAGCGDDGGSEVADTTTAPADSTTTTAAEETTTTLEETLPEADPSTYIGRNRVVHLLVLPDGSTPTLDVWAARSFEYAPTLLVEGLEYGEVSDWYGRPEHVSVIVVESGAGPDAERVADLFSANDGETATHLVMFDRDRDAAAGFLLEDDIPTSSNTFPEAAPGTGLVQLFAYQLRLNPLSEGQSFDQTIAGLPTSFSIGIVGVEGCAPQPRQTDTGGQALTLGGTQRVPFDLQPGTTSFTFHGWGNAFEDCADPTMFGPIDVTVEDGQRAWVLFHSRDGESIEALTVPLD